MPVSLLDFFILPVLRCFCGAVLFRSLCPSPNSSYPFWLLALTFRSSRPAFCGRLTSPVSLHSSRHIQVHALFPSIHHFKRFSAGCGRACWASPAGVALCSRYAGISAGGCFRPALYCYFCVANMILATSNGQGKRLAESQSA